MKYDQELTKHEAEMDAEGLHQEAIDLQKDRDVSEAIATGIVGQPDKTEPFKERLLGIMKEWDIPQKLILNNESNEGLCLKEKMFVGTKKPDFAFALFLHELAHAIQIKKVGETSHDSLHADTLTKLISMYCVDKGPADHAKELRDHDN